MEQLKALEIIALSMAKQALRGTLDGRDHTLLECRIRELVDLPPQRNKPRLNDPHQTDKRR